MGPPLRALPSHAGNEQPCRCAPAAAGEGAKAGCCSSGRESVASSVVQKQASPLLPRLLPRSAAATAPSTGGSHSLAKPAGRHDAALGESVTAEVGWGGGQEERNHQEQNPHLS